jgi:NAD(P)-dependent dehydrogenase (short-subunit alcohol dehydrogenase family)
MQVSKLAARAHATGRAIRPVKADVHCEDEVAAATQATPEWNGGLDILVCCAGRAFRGSALRITGADRDECLALNLRGRFLDTHVLHLLADEINVRHVPPPLERGKVAACLSFVFEAHPYAVAMI